MLLGNLDREMREFLGRAVPVLIPFFAFALGGRHRSHTRLAGGLLGLGLGLVVVVVTGIPLFFADRLTGGTGVAGLAAASTAGNAAAVPAIIAAANPAYMPTPRQPPPSSSRRASWSPRSAGTAGDRVVRASRGQARNGGRVRRRRLGSSSPTTSAVPADCGHRLCRRRRCVTSAVAGGPAAAPVADVGASTPAARAPRCRPRAAQPADAAERAAAPARAGAWRCTRRSTRPCAATGRRKSPRS